MSKPKLNSSYKKNFLKQVVLKLDFFNPIETLNNDIPKELSKVIKKFFPVAEAKQFTTQEIKLVPGNSVVTQESTMREWVFHTKEKDASFTITSKCLFFSYSVYKSFPNVLQHYNEICEYIFKTFENIQISRLGLRYINDIELNEGAPLDWELYLNKKLLSLIKLIGDKPLARIFHTIEFNFDDYNLRYQFGIPNPDYPSVIKKKNFVMDFDCYSNGLIETAAIPGMLNTFHKKIKEWFEKSITASFRDILNGKK